MSSSRCFGVEIECGHLQGYGHVQEKLKEAGLFEPVEGKYAPTVTADGSGVEIRSPILKGRRGFAWLEACLQLLRENNAYITNADGMHVHHSGRPGYYMVGVPQEMYDARARLAQAWLDNEPYFESFVASRRTRDIYVCKKVWDDGTIRLLKGGKGIGVGERFASLNMYHLRRSAGSKGTIEIRLHEGTLDFEEAEAWIHLGQALLDTCQEKEVPKAESAEAFLAGLKVPEKFQERLLEKRTRKGEPAKNSHWVRSKTAAQNAPWFIEPGSAGRDDLDEGYIDE